MGSEELVHGSVTCRATRVFFSTIAFCCLQNVYLFCIYGSPNPNLECHKFRVRVCDRDHDSSIGVVAPAIVSGYRADCRPDTHMFIINVSIDTVLEGYKFLGSDCELTK